MRHFAVAAILAQLSLANCAHTGAQFDVSAINRLTPNASTEADAVALLSQRSVVPSQQHDGQLLQWNGTSAARFGGGGQHTALQLDAANKHLGTAQVPSTMSFWIVVAVFFVALIIIAAYVQARKDYKQKKKLLEEKATMRNLAYDVIEGSDALPVIESPILLDKGELLHLAAPAELLALRTSRGVGAYHGPVIRVPIMKGVTYRAALFSGGVSATEEWKLVDDGAVFITDKRLLFQGTKKNTSIRLNKITRCSLTEESILRIDKDTGAPLVIVSEYGILIEAYLCRLTRYRSDDATVHPRLSH